MKRNDRTINGPGSGANRKVLQREGDGGCPYRQGERSPDFLVEKLSCLKVAGGAAQPVAVGVEESAQPVAVGVEESAKDGQSLLHNDDVTCSFLKNTSLKNTSACRPLTKLLLAKGGDIGSESEQRTARVPPQLKGLFYKYPQSPLDGSAYVRSLGQKRPVDGELDKPNGDQRKKIKKLSAAQEAGLDSFSLPR